MKHNSPTLYELIMVESLAHHKLIREAAEELNVSQSALSRQLSSLEKKLKTKIFNRDTRNFTITDTGREFIKLAEKILRTTDDAMNVLNPHLKKRLGRLTIAALPSITSTLLPKMLDGFLMKHPELCVSVNDLQYFELIEAVENGYADIGFTAGTKSLLKRLSFLPLLQDELTMISGKTDLSITKASYSLNEIIDMPIISMKKGTSVREFIDSACELENLTFSPDIEVNHAFTAVALVSEGLGISILPKLILPVLKTNGLNFHEINYLNNFRQIGIAHTHGKILSPAADRFLSHVSEQIQPMYQSIKMKIS